MILASTYFTDEAFFKIKNSLKDYDVKRIDECNNNTDVRALIIRSKDTIDLNTLKTYPNVEIISSATSGFDHIDFKSLEKKDVKLCHSPNANVQSASELTIFHILNFLKKGPMIFKSTPLERTLNVLGDELYSKKISIIGLGRIGSKVSTVLRALGAEVKAFDPYIGDESFNGVESVSFEEALQDADILSLHCPLTKKTRGLIDEKSLALMNPSSFLVNCARGELVDEASLLSALKAKKISGACLDVFEKEPLSKDSPLLKLNNVLTTPHIGGFTAQAQEKSALEAAQQVKNWFELSLPVLSSVPPDVVWNKDL